MARRIVRSFLFVLLSLFHLLLTSFSSFDKLGEDCSSSSDEETNDDFTAEMMKSFAVADGNEKVIKSGGKEIKRLTIPTDQELEALFRWIDFDKSGTISWKELGKTLKSTQSLSSRAKLAAEKGRRSFALSVQMGKRTATFSALLGGKIKLVISYAQILSQLNIVTNVKWPTTFNR
eukprot:g2057.t1